MGAPWASVADVAALTGVTVTAAQIVPAQTVIETLVGRTSDDVLAARDALWLKRAVAFQAVWAAEQSDALTAVDVSSSGQDGASASNRPDALILAPLARRTLKRLSWRGTRSVHTPSVLPGVYSGVNPAAIGVMGVIDTDDSAVFPDDAWQRL